MAVALNVAQPHGVISLYIQPLQCEHKQAYKVNVGKKTTCEITYSHSCKQESNDVDHQLVVVVREFSNMRSEDEDHVRGLHSYQINPVVRLFL